MEDGRNRAAHTAQNAVVRVLDGAEGHGRILSKLDSIGVLCRQLRLRHARLPAIGLGKPDDDGGDENDRARALDEAPAALSHAV